MFENIFICFAIKVNQFKSDANEWETQNDNSFSHLMVCSQLSE